MRRSPTQLVVVLATLSLLLGLMVPGAVAQTAGCGDIVSVSQLKTMLQSGPVMGDGLTVVRGTEPQPFTVEFLGVLDDGIGLGVDMIIVDVQADFIEDAGGIWQGMSGSPVYIDGRLVGAVSFGLSFVSNSIGALTPAQSLVNLIGLPDGDPTFASAEGAAAQDAQVRGPRDVEVTGELARLVRARLDDGNATRRGGDSVRFRQLAMPLSVSGLSPDRLDVVSQAFSRAGYEVNAYAGSSTAFSQVQSTTDVPVPGGNVAIADSYGDLTMAAVGTTSLVCNDRVVAFGHSFGFAGETLAGASTATAITIVPDAGFAPIKLANIGPVFGTFDQDRRAGIRGRNGVIPTTVPVTSMVRDLDGGSRRGRTDIVRPIAVPDLSAFHLLANIDAVIDRLGKGSSAVTLRVAGQGSESGPFTMTRENRYASQFDIAFESVFETLDLLSQLRDFRGEDVSFTRVELEAVLQTDVLAYVFDEVRVGVDGAEPTPIGGNELYVVPGSVLDIEVDLAGIEDAAAQTASLQLAVPEDAFGGFGFLEISGGNPFGGFFPEECFFNPTACQPDDVDGQSLQAFADELAAAPNNSTLTATLNLDSFPTGEQGEETATEVPAEPEPQPNPGPAPADPPAPPADESSSFAQANEPITASVVVDRVVSDFTGVPLQIEGGCFDCGPFLGRIAGDSRIETAAELGRTVFGVTETVVIAPAGDYPYALVAGPLAALQFAPVLLTDDGGLSPETAAAIQDLDANRAIVVASDDLLGGTLEADLAAAGIRNVQRIGGADRYAVAAAVAEEVLAAGGGTNAWLVEGENADPSRGWPDALAVGPLAAQEGAPILLTPSDALPEATATALTALGISAVDIAGGTGAVSAAVENDLIGRGITVSRVAGSNRFETSALLAERAIAEGAFPQNLWLVTGRAFPDGLAAASPVAVTGGVMLLIDGNDIQGSPPVIDYLQALAGTNPFVTLVGGPAAITPQAEEQIAELLFGGAAG